MRFFRRTLLCLAFMLGGSNTIAVGPPMEPPPLTPEELRAAEALRAEVAKAPILEDLPSISHWNESWSRDVYRLWLCGANGEDVVVLRRRSDRFLVDRTYEGDLEVRRKGALVSSHPGIVVCYAPFHVVEPPSSRFIVLMRPVEDGRERRIGAFVYEVPSLREAACIIPEKPDKRTGMASSHDYAAISQDGRALAVATGYVDLGVGAYGEGVLEIHAGDPLQRVRRVPPLPGNDARVIRMRFSHDGRRLAIVYRRLNYRHHLQVKAPAWEGSNVVAVNDSHWAAPVWADDGRTIFYGHARSEFKDGKLGEFKAISNLAEDMIVCLPTRTTDEFLAIGQYDNRITEGTRMVARVRPRKEYRLIALAADGRQLAVCTDGDGVGVWDVATLLKPK